MAVQVGDHIRVTYEGRVTISNDVEFTLDTGYTHMLGEDDDIEVIAAADDPSKDPVGTLRKSPIFGYVRVKVRRDEWRTIDDSWEPSTRLEDDDVVGDEIVGFITGTPVYEPLVVNVGDPEPHRDTVLRSDYAGGFTWRKDGDGWYWTNPDNQFEDEERLSWKEVALCFKHNFPLTQIN